MVRATPYSTIAQNKSVFTLFSEILEFGPIGVGPPSKGLLAPLLVFEHCADIETCRHYHEWLRR